MEDTTLIPLSQAAAEIGVKQETLYRAVYRGRLPATPKQTHIGTIWMVTREAVYAWRDDPKNHQRGRKSTT